ncbi:hypothetical protein Tco_0319344 [Tanacetum coccineum]
MLSLKVQQLLGENFAHTATKEPLSHFEGEKADMDTEEAIEKQPTKEPDVEKSMQEPARASRPIPITIVRPLMRPAPKIEMMSSSSTIQLNDTILEVLIPQPAVTDDIESPKKLVKTSSKVRPDPDEPVRVPYEIHGKLYHLTNHKIQEHLDKEEKMKKAVEKAKLLVMSRPELIKVVHKEALKDGIDPKILKSAKGGQEFKKIQDVEYKIEPDQGGLTNVVIFDNSNDPLLELPEFESFHFDLDPSLPRPPPEPPDVEISLIIETDAHVINNFDDLNEDECFDLGCLGYEWEGDGCEGLRGFGVSGVFVFVEWEGLVGIVGCGMGGVGWVMGGDGFLVGFGGGREGWGCGVMLVEGGRGGGGEVGGLWGGSRFGVRGLGLGI